MIAKDGTIKLHVNGKEVSGVSECKPRKGYLALESEGAECHFRNLKIKELPSSNPKPDEIADVAQGHKNLFNGIDLTGWKADAEAKKHWRPNDWVLRYDGKGKELFTDKEYGPAEFIVDFKFPKKDSKPCWFVLRHDDSSDEDVIVMMNVDGSYSANKRAGNTYMAQRNSQGKFKDFKPNDWNRLRFTIKGEVIGIALNNQSATDLSVFPPPAKGRFGLHRRVRWRSAICLCGNWRNDYRV